MYEFTFRGEAGELLSSAFEDLLVLPGQGVTILRGDIRDQAALHGVLGRINGLGLELLAVRLLADGDDS